MEMNKIYCGDNKIVMSEFADNSIDMILTSPPYDGLRDYNGFECDLHGVGLEAFRVLKEGGVFVMVIQDQTKDGHKTLTSFRTMVDYCDNIGFGLFENVIYVKQGVEGAWWKKRFRVDHEYIPIFIKGKRPLFFDKEHLKIPTKHGGKMMTGRAVRKKDGNTVQSTRKMINKTKCRGTLFNYITCGDGSKLKHTHPATFPDQLPIDFIKCFCPPDGVVLDPFVGSGTTPIGALKSERKYIGIDCSDEYCKLCEERIEIES